MELINNISEFLGVSSVELSFILLTLVLTGAVLNIIIRTVKSRRVVKNYTPTVGDTVFGYNGSNGVSGDITEVHQDHVYLKVKVSKDWLYPEKVKTSPDLEMFGKIVGDQMVKDK